MNVNSLLNARDRLAFVNTYPRSPPMASRGMIPALTPSAVKKDPEVMAASALASLLTSERNSVPVALQCQQYLQRQPQQAKAQPVSKKLELPERFTKNGRRRAIPFPLKLMQVLSDEQYCHIITWMPNGRSFVILRPKAFVSDILPKHFKSAQYASFTRKLARWGFTRCEDGTGEFCHPQFLKGRLDLAEKMACLGPSPNGKSSLAKNAMRQRDAPSATIDLSQDDEESPRQTDESVESASHSKSTAEPPKTMEHVQKERTVGNSLLGISTKKNHMLELELEAMRLRRYIHAAALSRRALADLQSQSLAPYLNKPTDRAVLHCLPELQSTGLNPLLYPMPGAPLSPAVGMRGMYSTSQGHQLCTAMPVRRFPNMKGAKTA